MITVPASSELDTLSAQIDDLRAKIDLARDAQPALWPSVLHKLKIRWTADSNAIEGSSLSFSDTLFFLEQGLTVAGKPVKDFLDAQNHAEAIELVYDVATSQRAITEGLLKELNALILTGVVSLPTLDRYGRRVQRPANPGQYKTQPNFVLLPDGGIHAYVDPVHVASEMALLVGWIEGDGAKPHPAVVAALTHWHVVRVHPFEDGNGRLARLLMNLVLIRSRFPPAIIRNDDRAAYLTALRAADAGDEHAFVLFVMRSLLRTLTEIQADLNLGV